MTVDYGLRPWSARQQELAPAAGQRDRGGESGKGDAAPLTQQGMQVRRLVPEECEALQGFPRGYTNIPFTHGKPAADGPRYKALGNSMAVPVMTYIGQRIQLVDWLYANS